MIKKILFIVILGLFVLVVQYFYSTTNTPDQYNNSIDESSQVLKQKNNNDLKGSVTDKLLPVSTPSNEVLNFNHYLERSVNTIGLSLEKTILDDINGTIDENNIDEAVNELKKIEDDPEKYQLVMRELYNYCNSIKLRENGKIPSDTKTPLSAEYQFLAIQRSGYCSILMTDKDPFFLTLELARKGDKLAQLFLADDLSYAIRRELINPKLFPLEYNDLRTEIIDYLRQLSASGVTAATIHLTKLHSNGDLIPEDRVLEYYYAKLTDKQSNNRLFYRDSSSVLYDRLTEPEKNRADRLTKNLK